MDVDPSASSDLSRRQVLRTGALGLGVLSSALALGQLSTAAPAAANDRVLAAAARSASGGQGPWSFCRFCYGLAWPSSGSRCWGNPNGRSLGPHARGSTFYYVYYGESFGQSGWRFCTKCHLMHYGSGGSCPGGGGHSAAGSYNYNFGYSTKPGGYTTINLSGSQSGWRYCSHCRGLWFAAGRSKGACPLNGEHIATGYYYSVSYPV
jgi:hypothetical protein